MEKLRYIVNIVIVALLFGAVAISRDGRVAGIDILESSNAESNEVVEPTTLLENGEVLINSLTLASDVSGYAGRTPIDIYTRDGIIERIEPQRNNETPSFFAEVTKSGLFERWNGMTLQEAATAPIDAVSGATYSSSSIIENVRRAAAYGANVEALSKNPFAGFGWKDAAGVIVILLGAIVVLLPKKSKTIEVIQLSLNVIVLGFWCGSFLSLSQITSWASNGINLSVALLALVLLIVTLIMPLLGKKGSYCYMHCPLGSAQELLGRVPNRKLKLSPNINKILGKLRYYILFALLMIMWLGVGFEIMDYELFSAFVVSSASTGILIAAGVFLVLSLFIHRPYCRFVCPTGALLTVMQRSKR